ncbi:MAG: hypothetical protein LBV75_06750 [Paludibacter sp.]|jgi:hypothetical protein|nr:hypothetical protein [Paludibacter sp.]
MQTAAIQSSRNLGSATYRAEQPRKLSKAGQWMRDHPDGIFVIVNRRAVNK